MKRWTDEDSAALDREIKRSRDAEARERLGLSPRTVAKRRRGERRKKKGSN